MKHFQNLMILIKQLIIIKIKEEQNSIYDFLVQLFDGKKDTLKRNENKIIISVKFPLGIKDEEISFEIFKKEVGLENNLSNIDKSLREINKDIISAKEEFKKNLLEKVYPIGSYYWSEKSISPDNIFGGSWKKIEGRFLFSSNYNHSVGETGGEERHYLTIDEIMERVGNGTMNLYIVHSRTIKKYYN